VTALLASPEARADIIHRAFKSTSADVVRIDDFVRGLVFPVDVEQRAATLDIAIRRASPEVSARLALRGWKPR